MKKNVTLCVFVFFLTCLIFFNSSITQAKITKGDQPDKIKHSAAGLDIHLQDKDKQHSIPVHIEMPLTHRGYHEATVHLDKSRKKIKSAHIRKPLIVEDYKGFQFLIKKAVYDSKTDSFMGHGEIKSTYLPGVLSAGKIIFNKKGIIEVDKIRPKGSCEGCKIANFPYTAEKITWTGNGIKSKGMLNLRKLHADVTVLVTKDGIEIQKFHGPVHCIVERRHAEITGLHLKGNQVYVDGKVRIHDGSTYKFKNVPVGPTGVISANVPKPKAPKPYPMYMKKKKSGNIFQVPMNIASGLAGLPGEKLIKIANTNMMMTVTSADLASSKGVVSGYIPLPHPIKRLNVFEARAEGGKAFIKNSKMEWHIKKIRVPIIHSNITLKTPITLKYDSESKTNKLVAAAMGTLKIQEVGAPAAEILIDNYEIDYRVSETPLSNITLGSTGKYTNAFLNVDQGVQFDVLETKQWIGYRCNVQLGSMSFSPANISWFSKGVMEKPSFFFEIHSSGYVKIKITTGDDVQIPIIPELLTLEAPGFFFLRQPGLITEFQVWGTFLPPPDCDDILRIDADFYVDKSGMYLSSGTGANIWLFDINIGEMQCAFSSEHMQFTVEGSFKIFGYKFSTTNCRITLKREGHRGNSNLFQGSSGLRIPYPCHCYWNKTPPFFHCHTCHKTIGIKVWIHWDGGVGFGLGKYHFKMPHGTQQAMYQGPFKADSLEYDGTLIIDRETGIQATGMDNIRSTSGHDSVSGSLNLTGSWLGEEMMTGTIKSNVTLKLEPDLPYADEKVNLTFNNLKRKFVKNPQTGIWINVDPGKVNVQFDFTKDGNSQTFNRDCQLRMNISDSILNIDLDLPSEFGGTYSQSLKID
ncbi:MAG: hypothetical protein K8T10_20080 [Candidatus Eremiobacteraeota bacterium]|nr:hypothetical protein [Candidatus Eremiobacteraeota bacterium]